MVPRDGSKYNSNSKTYSEQWLKMEVFIAAESLNAFQSLCCNFFYEFFLFVFAFENCNTMVDIEITPPPFPFQKPPSKL